MIISKYPILESSFEPFKTAGVMSDCLALKGALYAKIQLPNSVMHVVTTHTQATYFDSSVDLFCQSYIARYRQL